MKIEVEESWYEKLNRWQEALELYEQKQLETPSAFHLTLGRMRCMSALGDWERLENLASICWSMPLKVKFLLSRS